MKRLLALLLTLGLCALTACGSTNVSASSPGSYSSASSAEIGLDENISLQSQPAETPVSYKVETAISSDTANTDDGVELAQYRYELPTLKAYREDGTEITQANGPSEERALTETAAFNAQFNDWSTASSFSDTVAAAREDYTWRTENEEDWSASYDEDLTFTSYQTEHLVSIAAIFYSYTGGAHGNTALMGWTFNLDSGAFISPTALVSDEQSFLEAVTSEILRQAQGVAAGYGMESNEFYWEDYEQTVSSWPSYAVCFNENGMTVGFSPYEIACYAAGSQSFTIGYDFLLPYLSDQGLSLLGLAPAES